MNDFPDDPLGAFAKHTHVALTGPPGGPLSGLKMGVKDLFDIAGYKTGFGNPRWLETHSVANETASVVQRLLDAGADMVGKTNCDELCYSFFGENVHYGTPINVNAPGRIPGGSSSGSAAAVAGGLVDFALGSDTGGSVRLPACYCGLYGLRTTHGRISTDGVAPLAPGFDVVGWFARDGALLDRLAPFMFDNYEPASVPSKLLILQDAFEIAGEEVARALAPGIERLEELIGPAQPIQLGQNRITQMMQDFRILQGAEIWQTHERWITDTKPEFGPGITERIQWTSTIRAEDVAAAKARQSEWRLNVDELLPKGTVLCLPTAPGAPPFRGQPADELEDYRLRLLQLLSPAGLGELPQINLPLGTIEDCPLGLGLIAGRGRDETLLALSAKISEQD